MRRGLSVMGGEAWLPAASLCAVLLLASLGTTAAAADAPGPVLDEREAKHLANIRQVTFGFPRAGEGYFSPDGKQIVYQAYPIGYPFYQIYVQNLEGDASPLRLSPGRGRTTCAFFHPTEKRILYASAHTDPDIEQSEKKARELAAQGGRRRYLWDFDPHMDIYACDPDGTNVVRLTDTPGYDAEASWSPDGKKIVFTSTRDGDPDLYVMDSDGKNVRQIVDQPGYDGGPFFSPDGRWVVYRTDRRKEHMLQLHVVSLDGKRDVELTHDVEHVEWCPFFHPSGKYLVWSGADYSQGPQGAAFHLFTMDLDLAGETPKPGKVTQITFGKAHDVLPVFSPDGRKLLWTSTRTPDGKQSQLFLADWLRGAAGTSSTSSPR